MLAIDYRIKNNNCSTCQVSCHNLDRIDLPLLQCDAYNLPWNDIYAQLSVDSKMDTMLSLLQGLLDAYAPQKAFNVISNDAPWITALIRSTPRLQDAKYF